MERPLIYDVMIYFKMIRPGTLAACISPVMIGLSVASHSVRIDILLAVLTLLTACSIQIMSNLVNDYFDFKKGNDKEGRLGPARAVSLGLVSVQTLLRFIFFYTFLSILGGIALVWVGGIPILLIGVSALIFAVLYSATSKSLSHLGIADIFVLLYYGPLATLGTTYLQTMQFSLTSLLWGIGCGVISIAVLVVNNVRDYEQDKEHGKKTLIVRLGLGFGRIYYILLILLPVLMLFVFATYWQGIFQGIIGIILIALFLHSKGRAYNLVLILTGVYNLFFTLNLVLI
ncbi:MAG TPA: 1,4-dihydroxy-2-naphthoate octaprenyltransferase [Porphyromonadaceae bacterium]|nr:1,4-dihydroxy-2-naphthoate octaprenyltransferase [Porphyromonadaceae bacterium]